jgi:Raf kinase inhibitor-like YbhB/YbcL family protein
MRTITLSFSAIIICFFSAFKGPATLKITSPAFAANASIPVKYTCMGSEFTPPLHVESMPPGTKSLAMVVFDVDAVTTITDAPVTTLRTVHKKGHHSKKVAETKSESRCVQGYTHLVMWNIDALADIPENFRSDNTGLNSSLEHGYRSICPPKGLHHYHFIVYALDTKLNISNQTNKNDLEKVIAGHIIGKGELVGIYDRNYK